jgi:hypothetical protein
MYQQFINEHRANQYQQDCRRAAATERTLRAGRQPVNNVSGHVLLPWPWMRVRPVFAWFIIAAHHALVAGSVEK